MPSIFQLRRAGAFPSDGYRYWNADEQRAVRQGGTKYTDRTDAEIARKQLPRKGSGWQVIRVMANGEGEPA